MGSTRAKNRTTNSIPIFDACTHPTLNGQWLPGSAINNNHVGSLTKEMLANNVRWALAIGMQNIGAYAIGQYVEVGTHSSDDAVTVYPIAYCEIENCISSGQRKAHLDQIKSLGYRGIKLHPRFSRFALADDRLGDLIKEAVDRHLAVLLCTYFYDNTAISASNNIDSLAQLLTRIGDAPILLMHAGGVRVLEFMELARAYKRVLLDLSLTLCKYEGSSIDQDLAFMFKKFDHRICIGSDSPEYSLSDLRRRFECFCEGLSLDKQENIGSKNLAAFMSVDT